MLFALEYSWVWTTDSSFIDRLHYTSDRSAWEESYGYSRSHTFRDSGDLLSRIDIRSVGESAAIRILKENFGGPPLRIFLLKKSKSEETDSIRNAIGVSEYDAVDGKVFILSTTVEDFLEFTGESREILLKRDDGKLARTITFDFGDSKITKEVFLTIDKDDEYYMRRGILRNTNCLVGAVKEILTDEADSSDQNEALVKDAPATEEAIFRYLDNLNLDRLIHFGSSLPPDNDPEDFVKLLETMAEQGNFDHMLELHRWIRIHFSPESIAAHERCLEMNFRLARSKRQLRGRDHVFHF